MRLALYQGPPGTGDPEAGLTRLGALLDASARAGALMLVCPELFLPGYNRPDLHGALAQPRGGDWTQRLSAMARAAGCGLVLGWAERDGAAVYNAATAWDAQGQELGHYRKIQLFGPMEKASFRPGASYCLFDLAGVRAALLICYDVEFAPHVAALAAQGARLILVPAANPEGFGHVSTALVPARAAEAGVTIAYANYCGAEAGLAYGGLSLIVGPDARPLVSAGRGEALLIADLDVPLAPELRSTQQQDYLEI